MILPLLPASISRPARAQDGGGRPQPVPNMAVPGRARSGVMGGGRGSDAPRPGGGGDGHGRGRRGSLRDRDRDQELRERLGGQRGLNEGTGLCPGSVRDGGERRFREKPRLSRGSMRDGGRARAP